ncbi:MAG: 30S ribosomal protein S1 [Deltaproteobacteria bacterium]|nr:30S ribosomal protein S1 [Deltaproteobacteria bacterium]
MEKVACEVTQEQTLTADSDEEAEISQEDSQVLEENVSSEEAGDMGAFEDLFEQSLRTFQEGEILEGTVVRIDKESVMIDVGYKSEGLIPIREFRDEEGEITVSPGDTAEVLLERWDPDEGMLRLSHSKALRRQVWEEIAKAFEAETPVKATVSSRVKGGLSVRIGDRKGGVTAFLPFSQIDLMPVRDPEALSNQTIECAVLKCNRRRENVVVSRRFLLEKEMAEKRVNTLASLEEGQVREGDVKNITDYGVFVDLGGIDGLLHITDMSWGRVEHPSRLFNVGDTIKVKILTFDRDSEKVSLGAKQLTEDPWSRVEEKYPVGEKVTGKVVSLTDYGVFIELEEGVEGLIHVSEMSWTERIRHPSQIVNVGDIVEAIVLKVDSKAQRISLGLKQIEPNPWDLVQDRYPIGTVIEGSVKNITEFGLFIGIEEGIDGLVHISDLSWSKRIKHPNEIYKKGETIEAVVLNIDKEKERFSLGVKQLHPDPWESAPERYPVDSQVTGKVTNVTDFGVFVELEEGVEGLIHISELGPGKIKTPVGMFQVGDEISAKVIHVAPLERRIGLSVKRISEDEERSHFDKYNGVERSAGNTLGSLLQEELVQRNRARSEEDKDQKE